MYSVHNQPEIVNGTGTSATPGLRHSQKDTVWLASLLEFEIRQSFELVMERRRVRVSPTALASTVQICGPGPAADAHLPLSPDSIPHGNSPLCFAIWTNLRAELVGITDFYWTAQFCHVTSRLWCLRHTLCLGCMAQLNPAPSVSLSSRLAINVLQERHRAENAVNSQPNTPLHPACLPLPEPARGRRLVASLSYSHIPWRRPFGQFARPAYGQRDAGHNPPLAPSLPPTDWPLPSASKGRKFPEGGRVGVTSINSGMATGLAAAAAFRRTLHNACCDLWMQCTVEAPAWRHARTTSATRVEIH